MMMQLPVVHHPAYAATLPENHRFPMGKFKRLAEILIEDNIVAEGGFIQPCEALRSWLVLAHDAAYVDAVLSGSLYASITREIGLPVDMSVTSRACAATGGTVLTATLALERGLACNTAGGSHHARREQGAGFCVFNDVAVAACVLRADGLEGTILIVDCDVHQGDGTADIFRNDPSVFTFSIHNEKNYPVRKIAGDLDIGLADGLGDVAYMERFSAEYTVLLDRLAPSLIFYNAGVDPHGEDRLGRLQLTDGGLAARDNLVIGTARRRGIPIACVIGGGYSNDIDQLARRHAILHRTAARFA